MCGIFGWTFGPNAPVAVGQREAFASSLALANGRRGPHSWGVYMATREAEGGWKVEGARRVGNIANERGLGALGAADVMMGHTRWATTGAVTEANCHPFTVGEVTVAHNGMIYNHREIAERYGRQGIDCDSVHIAHHLHERREFGEFQGYGSIMYVRTPAPGDVHLCRMKNGQLSIYGLGERGKPWGIAWSSDEHHLKNALHAARIRAFPYEVPKEGRVYVAGADGVLYLLPASVSHLLGDDSLSPEERRRNAALTSGHGAAKAEAKSEKSDPVTAEHQRSLTEREVGATVQGESKRKSRKSAKGKRRAERRAQQKAGAPNPRPAFKIGTLYLSRDTVGGRLIRAAAATVVEAVLKRGSGEGERVLRRESTEVSCKLRALGWLGHTQDDVEPVIEAEVHRILDPRTGSAAKVGQVAPKVDLFADAEPHTPEEQIEADARAFLTLAMHPTTTTTVN